MDSFVLCVRGKVVGEDAFGDTVGGTNYLSVKDGVMTPLPSHNVSLRQWLDGITAAASPAGTEPGRELDVVFFVHGYNMSAADALARQRLVAAQLKDHGYPCVVVGFDWPSAGKALYYAYDRSEAQDTAALLVRSGIMPFVRYSATDCTIKVHVMAHSMGAFVVREAFRSTDKGRNADLACDWRVGQMVLFAADLSSSSFTADHPDMASVFGHCGRLTNYYSGYDEALAVSNVKNLDIDSRVGRVGMPDDQPWHDKAVDVDCGPRYKAVRDHLSDDVGPMPSHSWYLEDDVWYQDLAATLKGDCDRNLIDTRQPKQDSDFVLIAPVAEGA
jgi:pimeloyl-ACP methyl ester carboxylesterase